MKRTTFKDYRDAHDYIVNHRKEYDIGDVITIGEKSWQVAGTNHYGELIIYQREIEEKENKDEIH